MYYFKKLLILSILIHFSGCVENLITIRVLPDGRSSVHFLSKGDSTDIFNHDFLHPSGQQWKSNFESEFIDKTVIWDHNTSGLVKPNTEIILHPQSSFPYSFITRVDTQFFYINYTFKAIFPQLLDYSKSPLLSESLLTNKLDSIHWLPETVMSIIDSALNQIYDDSTINLNYPKERISNHFNNTLFHIKKNELLDELTENRITFLKRILKPFDKLDPLFAIHLSEYMMPYQFKIENTIHLKDDQFIFRLLMPGTIHSTNAPIISGDTLKWDFGLNSFLNQPYELNATSTIYSVKDLQKIITLSTLILLIGLGLFFKKRFL